ncbi:MAG: site-specific tyrosine recombinase XerD [Tannerella sp.]|jgi:integrase/recombinase XerD|nr:site-specific tyrosine recombinase XerD [Tannerella sp.]
MPSEKKSVVTLYRQHLMLEKGLSANTIEAYAVDLEKLQQFVLEQGIESVLRVTHEDLQQFMAQLHDEGISPRSRARTVSGIRSFYRFLLLDDYVRTDPTELLEAPRIGMKLPEVLSVGEIDRILASIDLSQPQGQRNRAMLEVLYSCGLRVSELTGLKRSDVYFEEEFITVEGKGSKRRLVPISPGALHEIRNYLHDRQRIAVAKGFEDTLFLNGRGKALTRVTVFHVIRTHAGLAGITKTVSPHTFRHSFATHLLEGGAHLRAIQMMLGHEKITTTELYTHLDRESLRREIVEHHPRNKGK